MTLPENDFLDRLLSKIGKDCLIEASFPKERRINLSLKKGCLREAVAGLKDEGFHHLSAITGYDSAEFIELLYHLDRGGLVATIRVKLAHDSLQVHTVTDIIPGACFYEAEVHELLGVEFIDSLGPTRLVLPDNWPLDSFPLRKKVSKVEI